MKRSRKIGLWHLICGAVALVAIIAHSPLVIPPNQFEPMLAGLPLTLWAGMALTVAIALLTFVGALVHPSRDLDDSE